LIMVLLPAPFSPTSAWTSPRSALNDALRRALTPPKDFEIASPSMLGTLLAPSLENDPIAACLPDESFSQSTSPVPIPISASGY
jgi:hypothetical protein